jgi:Major Facilitator Superfamily
MARRIASPANNILRRQSFGHSADVQAASLRTLERVSLTGSRPLPTDANRAGARALTAQLSDSRRFRAVALGAGLVLIAFNGRAAVGSVGPVLPEAMRAVGLSAFGASLLTTLPSLCFGLGAPLAPALARRLGDERSVLVALLMIALGVAMRGWPTAPSLYAGQILACAGIAVINVLLLGLVKRDFPRRVGLMTGLVSMDCARAEPSRQAGPRRLRPCSAPGRGRSPSGRSLR